MYFTEEECYLLDQISFRALEEFNCERFICRLKNERKNYIESMDNIEQSNNFTIELLDGIIEKASPSVIQKYFYYRNHGVSIF